MKENMLKMTDETNTFLYHWCEMYGLSEVAHNCLKQEGLFCGNDLIDLDHLEVQEFELPFSQKCLLRGALLQYRGSRSRADREIAKIRGVQDVPARPSVKGWSNNSNHRAFDKVRAVVHRLNQLEGDDQLGDTHQGHFIRELKKRLHKKRNAQAQADGLTLAQRILLSRQQTQEERPRSAPPKETRCRSLRSLTSVQSSPACPQRQQCQSELPRHPEKPIPAETPVLKPDKPKKQRKPKISQQDKRALDASQRDKKVSEDKNITDILAEIDKISQPDKTLDKKRDKHEGELQKRESQKQMEEAVRKLEQLFDDEELALIAAIDTERKKDEQVIKDADLDKMVNGDFHKELDTFLETTK